MSNYVENKKKIEEIRNDVGEALFRMAISHLMDVGIRHLDEAGMRLTCNAINKEDDTHSFMTNEFKCNIVKTAGELAKIEHLQLLNYISKEVFYDVGDSSLPYERMKILLCNFINSLDFNYSPVDTLREIGFEDEELVELGFESLLDDEEEEE
jgi:hypothetical protein